MKLVTENKGRPLEIPLYVMSTEEIHSGMITNGRREPVAVKEYAYHHIKTTGRYGDPITAVVMFEDDGPGYIKKANAIGANTDALPEDVIEKISEFCTQAGRYAGADPVEHWGESCIAEYICTHGSYEAFATCGEIIARIRPKRQKAN